MQTEKFVYTFLNGEKVEAWDLFPDDSFQSYCIFANGDSTTLIYSIYEKTIDKPIEYFLKLSSDEIIKEFFQ